MAVKLVEIRIRGLRTLADVTLPLDGVTVLIGENGTGKSSILESLRIAKLFGGGGVARGDRTGALMEGLGQDRAVAEALRRGASELQLDLRVESQGRNLIYSVSINPSERGPRADAKPPGSICLGHIVRESVFEIDAKSSIHSATTPGSGVRPIVIRNMNSFRTDGSEREWSIHSTLSIFDYFGNEIDLPDWRPAPTNIFALASIRSAISGIDVYLPGDDRTRMWAGPHTRGDRLGLFDSGIAHAYHSLKFGNSSRWQDTLELLRIGLGYDLRDIHCDLRDVHEYRGGMSIEFDRLGTLPMSQISDGQLAYLSIVALVQLDSGRTLLTLDDPERHLHPLIISRAVQILEDAGKRHPILLATHSDRLLDAVSDPIADVRVCELDAENRTIIRGIDRSQFEIWTDRYSGLGEIRAAGQLDSVILYGT